MDEFLYNICIKTVLSVMTSCYTVTVDVFGNPYLQEFDSFE